MGEKELTVFQSGPLGARNSNVLERNSREMEELTGDLDGRINDCL